MAEPGWVKAHLSYAGWVPNVGSHLSFSLIGSRAGKGVVRLSARVDYTDYIARVVCAMQSRTTDDMLLPPYLARRQKPDLRQDWILIGETIPVEVPTGEQGIAATKRTVPDRIRRFFRPPSSTMEKINTTRDEQGALFGRVLIIPYEEDPDARSTQEKMLDDLRARLSLAARKGGGKNAIKHVEAEVLAGSPGLVSVNFALMRTGEVRIWFESQHAALDDEGHRQIARQAYFFIKDMSHRHVHHDHLDDQITPLIPFKSGCRNDRLKSEVAWRRETLWSLSRFADKRMGSDKLNFLREALGMLAYADAFQKTLLQHVRDPDDALAYLPNLSAYGYDFQHIRESTRVRIDQTAARRTVTGQLIAAVFAGAIASLSLVSSLISTRNAGISPLLSSAKFKIAIWPWLLETLGNYPVAIMGISAYILYAAFALTLSDILFTQPRRRFQYIRGMTLSFSKKHHLNADQSFRMLVLIYIALIALLLAATAGLTFIISRLPLGLGLSKFFASLYYLGTQIPPN